MTRAAMQWIGLAVPVFPRGSVAISVFAVVPLRLARLVAFAFGRRAPEQASELRHRARHDVGLPDRRASGTRAMRGREDPFKGFRRALPLGLRSHPGIFPSVRKAGTC